MSAGSEQDPQFEERNNEIQSPPETSDQRPDEFRDYVIEKHQLLLSIPQKLEDMIAENEKLQAEVQAELVEAQEKLSELVRKRRMLVDKREPIAEVIKPFVRKLEVVAAMIGIYEDLRRPVPSQSSQIVAGDTPAPPDGREQSRKAAVPSAGKKPKRGRPRKDKEREMIGELLPKGLNWSQIRDEINRKTVQAKKADAYRKLWGSKNPRPQKRGRN